MKFFERLSKIPLIKILSSVRIAVVCLFLLFVLTFWGTVAQVNQGLYVAQERFFASFFFLAGGVIPFPGAQLILWVLFINLMCVTITRFVHYFKPRYIGILIIHFGLLLYLTAAFVIFHVSVESNVHLLEHEGTNISSSYHQWELACWKDSGKTRKVTAYDVDHLAVGTLLKFNDEALDVVVKQYYPNAHAYSGSDEKKSAETFRNSSGIVLLELQEVLKEREKNIAGGVFEINVPGQKSLDLLLYGSDPKPTSVTIGKTNYLFRLQHKKYQLPLTIELLDFRVQFHPGTQTAKSYESTVRITHDGVSREVVISMNNPLRDGTAL